MAPSLSRRPVVLLLVLAGLALAPAALRAQQTIINVPSVDQTKKGHVFFLHETQARSWGGQSFWQTTHFLTYGVTDRFEIATTLYNFGTPLKQQVALGIGWKTAQPLDFLGAGAKRWEATFGAGQMVPISLRGDGVGLWSYAQVAARIPGIDLRVMGGISNGPRNLFGFNTTHFIGSYELPLEKLGHAIGGGFGDFVGHMALLGEWWSGQHEFADFVPGVNWHSGPLVVILGYKFGNQPGTASDGVIFEVGTTF
ncbi:MAG: hypothetical protein NW201_06955 [Gemmatimonadales bacterium]|nr:hypothetical protein [Gemmatimonadales bacterium]